MIVHLFIIILTVLLMATGLAGSVLPGLPGSPLILLGAFIYAWHTGFELVTWITLLWLLILTLLSHFLDFLASLVGVKKSGGSRWGMAGAFMGGFLGLFVGGIPGLIFASFLGAFLLEMIHTRSVETSLKSGLGALIGFLFGAMGKVVIAVIMIGIFIGRILP